MRKTFYGNIGGAYEVELLPREEIEKRLDELALNKGDIIRKAYDAYAPGWRVDVWLDPTDGEVFTTTFSTGERLQRDAHLIHLFTLDPREMAEIGWRELLGEEEFEKARQEAEARDMDLEEYMTEVRGWTSEDTREALVEIFWDGDCWSDWDEELDRVYG